MNAKEEFLSHIANRKVLCAEIIRADEIGFSEYLISEDENELDEVFLLPKGYSEKDFDEFVESLDFDYNDGYGSQQVFGTIWYEDGTWSEREEYDGSEWWWHLKLPEIPEKLLTKNVNNS